MINHYTTTPQSMQHENKNESETEDGAAAPYNVQTFEITTVKSLEIDMAQRSLERVIQQTGTDSGEVAIEHVVAEAERDDIDPKEKLLGLNVTVDEVEP